MARVQGLKFDVGDRVVYETLDTGTTEMLRRFFVEHIEDEVEEWREAAEQAACEIQAHEDAVGKTFVVVNHIYPGANPFQIRHKGYTLCVSGDCLRAA